MKKNNNKSNNNSSRADLGVFDFNVEIDSVPTKWTPKFGKTKFSDSAIDKYNFLQNVARGSGLRLDRSNDSQCVDVDTIDVDDDDGDCRAEDGDCRVDDGDCQTNDIKRSPLAIPLEDHGADLDCTPHGSNFGQSASGSFDEWILVSGKAVEQLCYSDGDVPHSKSSSADLGMRIASTAEISVENDAPGSTVRESPLSNGSVGAASSDVVDNSKESSISTPTSVLMENNDRQANCHSCSDIVMEDADTTVVLHADYVSYNNRYCPASEICFSCKSFKIEVLYTQEEVDTNQSEWDLDDIVSIQVQWNSVTKTATIRLRILARESCKVGASPSITGTEELEAVIHDPNWFREQEKIMLLSLKYKDLWTTELNIDQGCEGVELPMDFRGGPYFPDFDETFQEVVYPEGEADAVSISKRDVDLLQPETFVNDTIIDFYIKYLKNKIPSGETQRFHFFNSFFFRKLADLDKNPASAFDGKAAFQRVRKWTRKHDLFGKDYIFIPVNYNLHWSLIVICHPGDVADFEDGGLSKSSRVPCILHMDSIRGSHTGLRNLIQSYLWEEWKERRKEESDDIAAKFMNLRFLSLELPQQENCYDCGLFLLHYVELFVAEAPVDFNPFKITKFSNFLSSDWFLPSEVSLKRTYIQRVICDLLANRARSSATTSCANEHQSSELPEISGNDISLDLVSNRSIQRKASGNSLFGLSSQGSGMDLFTQSSFRNCDDTYGTMRGIFEAESYHLGSSFSRLTDAAAHADIHYSPCREEEAGAPEDHSFMPMSIPNVSDPGYMPIFSKAEPSKFSYQSGDLGDGISCDPGISYHDEEDDMLEEEEEENEYEEEDEEEEEEEDEEGEEEEGEEEEEEEEEDVSSPVSDSDSDNLELEPMGEDFDADPVSIYQNVDDEGLTSSLAENIDYVAETLHGLSNVGMELSTTSTVLDNAQNCTDEGKPLFSDTDGVLQSNRESGADENIGATGVVEHLIVDDSSSDSDALHVAKRLRRSPSFDGEGEGARCEAGEPRAIVS